MSKPQTKKRVGVLISGRGSNLQSLIDAARAEQYPAEIALVISDKPDAYGLQRAKEAGIETRVIERKDFADKPAFEAAIDDSLRSADIEIVCLAGFMRLLSPWLVDRWLGKLINIHPSLLPSFKGLDAQGQAIRAGVRIAGCTVHFVTAEMDGGPIIQQASVPVLTDDTPDSLSDRILTLEHKIYPEALAMLANGGVTLDRNRATFA
ncbi:MAG: phosphoribosylglycinamide formyltransferase [Alphaproteobacteria bacterium]|nr:phosphoribosylglycinamide formyltransferase [Alphaproteobacteria bacterium]MAS49153.1 phosphoribosylglycinamide formyltransferase [Alphaproteobacteria bacterium]MAX97245.1 phosphoribosylglycinamide formyltransferase [Alphaproteobacteria bacterium]MBN52459.1 phosphoribosylglycinamide formyltransferase [Alphaproteobacteria bacterium]OUT39750.1 MAG: phosphoribosylglycinamide formyltransferase [Micavibrio sp. TMED2]|tara:strand:- start:61464 stop:62084 length:621 start_codon:yes stop_codon:yes gene_type:complete